MALTKAERLAAKRKAQGHAGDDSVDTETKTVDAVDSDVGTAASNEKQAKQPKEKEQKYEILTHRAIIGGVMFPNEKAKKGEENVAWLVPSEAARHQSNGVALRAIDDG